MKRIARALVLLVAVGASAARAGETPSFDYLWVRAHEGNAAGGHAAIRFGAAIYDFQHADGLVVPRREDAGRFQHLYRTLENRSIERSRIAASAETVALLSDTFERRLLAQSRQIAIAAELRRDVVLLEALARGESAAVLVRGAGFFEPIADTTAAALRDIAGRVAASHGEAWMEQRDAEARRGLRALPLAPPAVEALAIDPLRHPVAPDALSRRVAMALAARRAAAVLAAPHALRTSALVGDDTLALDAAGAARLGEVRESLLASATRLAASRRPDWGEAFLLAAARIAAIDASLEQGRLLVLDALPAHAHALPATRRRRTLLPVLFGEAGEDVARAREAFFATAVHAEADHAALEAAVSRLAALRAFEAGEPALRVAPGALLADASAPVSLEPRPALRAAEILDALAATRAAEATLRRRLEDRYGYDLVRRNCVTEIFRTVEIALGDPAESEHRLGGYVAPAGGANFVPFVSSRRVRAEWNVADHARLASARAHAAREGSLATLLRESNAITSSFYEPADGAGFFVFFGDAPWPLRPLLGAVNLAAGLLRGGVGLATFPFDGGGGLRRGLDGAFWSVPELVFANVRKGTSDWVAPELRPPAE